MFYPRHVGPEKRNGLSQVKCEERTFFKNLKGNIIDTPSVMLPVLLITTLVFLPFRNHMVCVCWTALCHHSLLREHPEHMATIPQHLPQDVTDLGSLILHLNEQEPNFLQACHWRDFPGLRHTFLIQSEAGDWGTEYNMVRQTSSSQGLGIGETKLKMHSM